MSCTPTRPRDQMVVHTCIPPRGIVIESLIPPPSSPPSQGSHTPAMLPRRHSQHSLHSTTSIPDAAITYFSASRPRDPNVQLAVQFQEAAEAVRSRRAGSRASFKLEPGKGGGNWV